MKVISQQFLTLVTMTLFVMPLSAQGLYTVLSVGQAQMSKACDQFGNVGFSGRCDDDDTAWKATIAYQFTPIFAVEAFYANFGLTAVNGSIAGQPVVTEADLYGFGTALVARVPLTKSLSVFGKAGLLIDWDVDYSGLINASGQTIDFDDDGLMDPMYGIGADYAVNKALAMRVEWEHFDEIDVDMFSAGLIYRFRP